MCSASAIECPLTTPVKTIAALVARSPWAGLRGGSTATRPRSSPGGRSPRATRSLRAASTRPRKSLKILAIPDRRQVGNALCHVRQWNLNSAAAEFVDHYQAPIVGPAQLLVRVEQLDSINGTVRGKVDVHLIAQANRFYLDAHWLAQAQISDIATRIVAELHSLRLLQCLEVFHDYADHQPIAFFPDSQHLNLLHMVVTARHSPSNMKFR